MSGGLDRERTTTSRPRECSRLLQCPPTLVMDVTYPIVKIPGREDRVFDDEQDGEGRMSSCSQSKGNLREAARLVEAGSRDPYLAGSGRFRRHSASGVTGSQSVDLQGEGPAPFVQSAELAVDDGDLAVVLDPHLPVSGLGDAAEAAPVDDEPLVDAAGTGAFDLLGARAVGLDQPVDVLRSEALGVVDVELAPLLPLGSSQ